MRSMYQIALAICLMICIPTGAYAWNIVCGVSFGLSKAHTLLPDNSKKDALQTNSTDKFYIQMECG